MPEKSIASSQCNDCRRVIVPPRGTCPYCGITAGPMKRLELLNLGTIQSYTTLELPPQGFQAPLSIALVELEHGALILCLARDSKSTTRIGEQVEITVDSENRFLYRSIN